MDTTERLHFHSSLSCIGEGHGNPLQCSCLENPRDGGAWWAAVYGVAHSRTRLKRLSSSCSSPPLSIPASSNQQMARQTPSCSLYYGCKSGLRTPVQRRFSLELARCSNSISHSNKLYLSFVLSHIWKFFSNPCADHDVFGGPYRELRWPTSFLKRTLCQEASAVEAIGEFWPGLPSGVFQRPHYPLSPSRRCPNG